MSLLPPPTLPRSSTRQVTPASKDTSFNFRTTTWQADGFGFDATSGEFFTASPTALLVMQCLAAKMSTAQIRVFFAQKEVAEACWAKLRKSDAEKSSVHRPVACSSWKPSHDLRPTTRNA